MKDLSDNYLIQVMEDVIEDLHGHVHRVSNLAVNLGRGLGLGEDDLVGLHRSRFDLVVEVGSARTVRRLAPRLDLVAGLPARGVIVTARGDGPGDGDGADFVSRFFGPAVGVPENPVTGSAHCALAPFWAARLGKDEMTGYQASRRGGTVRVRLAPGGRVRLAGRAVTVLMGEIAT